MFTTPVIRTLLSGALSIAVLLVWHLPVIEAQVMQSSSYQIESDSINVGGIRSSSTSYTIEDTAGEIATGESSSSNFSIRAGYQQMQEVYLALTSADNVTMSPSLGGLTGGTANGSTSVIAITDGAAGYQLVISASTSPALQSVGGDTIADYSPSGDPDFVFTYGATESVFGFSPEGDDIADRFKDNGSACNTGSGDVSLRCWDGLSTSNATIAERQSSNHPDGSTTTIQFQVGIGASSVQAPGTYTATSTITLIAL